jgi:hypothetical protein
MPQVQVLHQEFTDNPNVVILAMNVGDENEKMATWWKQKKYGFRTLNDADKMVEIYGIKAFPSTVLIGPDGKVIKTSIGSAHTLKRTLNKELEKTAREKRSVDRK